MSARSLSVLCLFSLSLAATAAAQGVSTRVTIESTPAGAKVYVDGKSNGMACQSGPTCKPRMLRGPHRVTLELEGYRALEEIVNVTGPQRYSFTLRALPGKLDVKTLATNTNASGGEVFVDGALSGTVPAEVEVPAGKHLVEVRRAGFPPYSESVDVAAGQTRPVFVALAAEIKASPVVGTMMVTSEPTGGEVLVDAQPRGPAPVLVENLPPGDHVVEIRPTDGSGRAPWRNNVRVVAGQQAAAYAVFAPIHAAPPPAPPPLVLLPPAPQGPILESVAVVPRDTAESYVVTTSTADSCTTPCTLRVPAGLTVLNVRGPASRSFEKQIKVPRGPSRITVQHYTRGRVAVGTIFLLIGLPAAAVGGWAVATVVGQPNPTIGQYVGTGFLAASGLAFTVAGLVELGSSRGNHVDVVSLAPRLALQSEEAPSPLVALTF